MRTLEGAFAWYETNRELVRLMGRLAGRHWEDLSWSGPIGRDNHFRHLDAGKVQAGVEVVVRELDDLGVFLLFSVFESIVRSEVAADLEEEVARLRHPALRRAAERLLENIEDAGFYQNVLVLSKQDGKTPAGREANDLIEQVNRIRRFRNWVAHGRKEEEQRDQLTPKDSLAVLRNFLEFIRRPPA